MPTKSGGRRTGDKAPGPAAGSPAGPAPSGIVNAAARAFAILERLADQRSVGLEELSREVGLAKPTVYRFLLTLQELGYARRAPDERWAMTLKSFRVGSRALDHLDLYEAARPVAAELAEALGETIHMGVLEEDSAVYVLKIESRYTIRMHSRVGRRVPLHCTSIGKCLLAFGAPEAAEELVRASKLVAFTPGTITRREAFLAELGLVRKRGYALDREEHEEGIRCIGAPVLDCDGLAVAALSASWPVFRYDESEEARNASAVVGAALRISEALGYDPAARRPLP
ncbi:MAG TPA: IclR family transcriptional regulator C-terminal domain-containing protein [Spirochaetales bacterium]|nr:IclR family transcriptional regulator C-terminal domain-containing protein [Spirochaetales bacterium]HRY53563.1 IclR family transcriptional regulator C-terminal domain-containing protein [Spirochaetia bacterium]HRZ63383.1 IclR family transcriptional regulator C-terminal domain-containing protein [Spirochaetia bacterium]